MISYPLTNVDGAFIGYVVLKDDGVPKLIMNNEELMLGGTYNPNTGLFLSFMLVPLPDKEKHGD